MKDGGRTECFLLTNVDGGIRAKVDLDQSGSSSWKYGSQFGFVSQFNPITRRAKLLSGSLITKKHLL